MAAVSAAAANDSTTDHPPSLPSPTSPPHQLPTPPYADKLTSIRNFSAALSTFLRRHDDLHIHLESIVSAVDSKLTPELSVPAQTLTLASVDKETTNQSNLAKCEMEIDSVPTQILTLVSADKEITNQSNSAKSVTEIESLCARASFRDVRRYIKDNLSNIEKLRVEIPEALKLAPNPANFVLKIVGKIYLQGVKAYDNKESKMIPARQVSILTLEFYLLMDRDGTKIDPSTRGEGQVAAVDWKKRLDSEGGLAVASLPDARGLLLLVGCYGVPKGFSNSDIRDLILRSGVREISDVLRRSGVLLKRVPAIIEKMMKNKNEYEVVDIIYAFGMENKYSPQPILVSFVQSSIENWNKARKSTSLTAQMDAIKEHLNDLKSVLAYLKEHKFNPSEIFPDFNKKISTLEKEIPDLKKKIDDQVIDKRRLEDTKPRSFERREERREEKRARLTDHMPRHHVDHVYRDERIISDGAFPGHLYPPPYDMRRTLHEDAALRERVLVERGDAILRERVLVEREDAILRERMLAGREDAILRERIIAERALVERYAQPPSALGVKGLYRPTNSLEGFAGGLSNPSGIGSSSRAPAPAPAPGLDLYQFADSVAEREIFGGSRAVPLPSVIPPRHPSYLF